MKKNLLLTLCLLLGAFHLSFSQNIEKSASKSRKSIFKITAYDADGLKRNESNGFFIDKAGTAITDFSVIKGADRAEITTSSGDKYPVAMILGKDDLYDVAKLKIDIDKSQCTEKGETAATENSPVYVVRPSENRTYTAGKITSASDIKGGLKYYSAASETFSIEKSLPALNEEGKLIGITQPNYDQDSTIFYILDINIADSLSTNAFSIYDRELAGINIMKALPADAGQAEIAMLLAEQALPADKYAQYIEQYMQLFPKSRAPYEKAAYYYLGQDDMKNAEKNIKQAMDYEPNKAEAHYIMANFIYNVTAAKPDAQDRDRNLDEAEKEIDKAIENNPLPLYMQLKANICIAAGKNDEALQCLHTVNRSNMATKETLGKAISLMETSGAGQDDIINELDSMIVYMEETNATLVPDLIYEKAMRKSAAGKYTDAIKDMQLYYESVSGNVSDIFYYNRKQMAMEARLYQMALDDITKAIELNPQENLYRLEKAALHIITRDYEKAADTLQEVLAQMPDSPDANRLMGLAMLGKGDKEKAGQYFKTAIANGDQLAKDLYEKNCNE